MCEEGEEVLMKSYNENRWEAKREKKKILKSLLLRRAVSTFYPRRLSKKLKKLLLTIFGQFSATLIAIIDGKSHFSTRD